MDIIGHQNIIKFLDKSINNRRLAHAYLFHGFENIGKETVAIDFIIRLLAGSTGAKDVLELKNQIEKRIHPDVYWLERNDDKKFIVVEQIRDVQQIISVKSFSGFYKILIINRAEEMNESAANSFLKILEEPPEQTMIILLVNQIENIPRTISSRCQLIKFNPVASSEIINFLATNYKLPESKAGFIARLAFGRPGLAIRTLDELENLENYKEATGDFLKIINANLQDKIKFVSHLGSELPFLAWQIVLRDFLMIKNQLPVVNFNFIKDEEIAARSWSETKIYQALKLIDKTKNLLKLNVNRKLALENLFINI